MKNNVTLIVTGILLVFSMILSACTQPVSTAPTSSPQKPLTTMASTQTPSAAASTTTQANWWDKFGKPQYGGTITYRMTQMSPCFDVYNFVGGEADLYYETLFNKNWTSDRKVFDFTTSVVPDDYISGLLADSWELPDAQTIIVHLRQGVYWQNKPPVNGREFVADDVVQHYDRLLGTGSGYTAPNMNYSFLTGNWDRVTATDKYTVVFKFKNPSGLAFSSIADTMQVNSIEAPEYVKQGDLNNWQNVAGTGPFMLTDFVAGNSFTYSKNPNYWDHDERYPENKVPYVDTIKMMLIPDMATAMAALRTGKVEVIGGEVGMLTWQQAKNLTNNNPEIQLVKVLGLAGGVALRCDKKPFTDINVRKALQLAIDRQTIAKNFYGGMVDGVACGMISPAIKGYCYPYDEWPQALKDEYSYNPDKAKQMLKDAGYSNGFSTNIVVSPEKNDLELLQIIKAEFKDIGVDMEIREMEFAAEEAFVREGKHDQMSGGGGGSTNPIQFTITGALSTNPSNSSFINDAGYDAIVAQYLSATSSTDIKRLVREADKYAVEKHWVVVVCPTAKFNAWQPYLKGYSGEALHYGQARTWARLWIDQSIKK